MHSPCEVSDETLIARYNRGDRAALGTLLERYRAPLYRYLLGMTGCESNSDDIFQETWLRIIKKSKGFRHENFKGWLFKIAHNLAIDRSRDIGKWVSLDFPAPGVEDGVSTWIDRMVSPNLGPDRQVNGHDTGRAINLALAKLPGEQRAVFLMRMESGMSFKDIAKTQKVSLNTALARMHYALKKMRILLEDFRREGAST